MKDLIKKYKDSIILIIANILSITLVSRLSWVNRQPSISFDGKEVKYNDFIDYYIGNCFQTIFVALLYTIIFYSVNENKEKKKKILQSILFFIDMLIINIIIFRLGVRTAV